MRITHWPEDDRPREKLLNKGEAALTDAELIAIFIKTGTRGKTAVDIAKELLTEYGNLKKLLGASLQMLSAKKGIGPAKYAALKAALELGKRYHSEHLPTGKVLQHTNATKQFLSDRMRHHPHEVFACLYLDSQCRLLSFDELFHGTLRTTAIYPREIVKRGLFHNAAQAILAHNHPSGEASPSQADKEITRTIKDALRLVDIEVIDHIIVGNPGIFSFKEKNLL